MDQNSFDQVVQLEPLYSGFLYLFFSSCPISLQFRVQSLQSIALCMQTEKALYSYSPPALSLSLLPFFFPLKHSLTSAHPLTEPNVAGS